MITPIDNIIFINQNMTIPMVIASNELAKVYFDQEMQRIQSQENTKLIKDVSDVDKYKKIDNLITKDHINVKV